MERKVGYLLVCLRKYHCSATCTLGVVVQGTPTPLRASPLQVWEPYGTRSVWESGPAADPNASRLCLVVHARICSSQPDPPVATVNNALGALCSQFAESGPIYRTCDNGECEEHGQPAMIGCGGGIRRDVLAPATAQDTESCYLTSPSTSPAGRPGGNALPTPLHPCLTTGLMDGRTVPSVH